MGKLERIGLVSFKATSSEEIRGKTKQNKTLSILGRTSRASQGKCWHLFPALDSRTITGLGTNLTAQIKEEAERHRG